MVIACKTLWTSFRDPVHTDRASYFATQKFTLWDWPEFTAPLFIVKLPIKHNYVKVEEYRGPSSLAGKPAHGSLRAAWPVLTPVTHTSRSQTRVQRDSDPQLWERLQRLQMGRPRQAFDQKVKCINKCESKNVCLFCFVFFCCQRIV